MKNPEKCFWAFHGVSRFSRKHLLASGNGRGEVKVWKLNDELVTRKPRDSEMLESLAMLQVD